MKVSKKAIRFWLAGRLQYAEGKTRQVVHEASRENQEDCCCLLVKEKTNISHHTSPYSQTTNSQGTEISLRRFGGGSHLSLLPSQELAKLELILLDFLFDIFDIFSALTKAWVTYKHFCEFIFCL